MRNVSDKSCEEIQKAHFIFRAEQATDGNIIPHMCFAYWMTKATDTQSLYVTLIASP